MGPSLRASRAFVLVALSAAAVGGCGSDEARELAGSSVLTSSSDAVTVATTMSTVQRSTAASPSLADVFIADPEFRGLPTSLAEELALLPELMAVSALRSALAVVDGEGVNFSAGDPSTVGLLFDLGVVEGAVEDLAGGGIMLHESRARDLGVGVGDLVEVSWRSGGSQQLEVVGVFADISIGAWLTSLDVLTEASDDPPIDVAVAARLADGTSEDVGRAAVAAVLDSYPTAQANWRSGTEFHAVEPDS